MRENDVCIRYGAAQPRNMLRRAVYRGRHTDIGAGVENHRKATFRRGAHYGDHLGAVGVAVLVFGMKLDPAQAELQHTVKLLLKSVHAGIDRAEGEIAVVSADGLGQKCVGVLDLTGIRCGVGDDAAGDARKLILRAQARHIGLPLDGNAVEAADGMRCLFGQLFRENMCVDVCDLHEKSSFILYGDMPGMQSRAFRFQSKFITLFSCIQVAEKPESAWDPGKILSLS